MPPKKRSSAAGGPRKRSPKLPAASPPATLGDRKVALDEGKRREVIAILSMGCTRRSAARYVGCHPSTITRTTLRDSEFEAQVRQAESHSEIRHAKNIDAAAKDARYWRAAAWALERLYPERWGPRRTGPSAEQFLQALEQFAQVVIEEVQEAETRERILKRLDELSAELDRRGDEDSDDET